MKANRRKKIDDVIHCVGEFKPRHSVPIIIGIVSESKITDAETNSA